MNARLISLTVLVSVVLAGIHAVAQSTQTPPAQPRPLVFVAVYERGPAWDDGKAALQQTGIGEHMKFLAASVEKLIGAAPFQQGMASGSSDRTVGMVIVMAATQDDAERLIAADPAIARSLMKATVRRWLVDRMRSY